MNVFGMWEGLSGDMLVSSQYNIVFNSFNCRGIRNSLKITNDFHLIKINTSDQLCSKKHILAKVMNLCGGINGVGKYVFNIAQVPVVVLLFNP